jgi:hypothetical protein
VENTKQGKDHQNTGKNLKWRRASAYSWLIFCVSVLIGFALGFSVGLEEVTERVKFFAGNILGILALIVIVGQLVISRRQTEIMDGSVVFGLRAHVGVHAVSDINFNEMRFVIEIGNSGSVPATRIDLKYIIEVRVPDRWADDSIRQLPWKQSGNDWVLQWGDSRYYGRAPLSRDLKIKKPINLSAMISSQYMFEIWQGHAQITLKGNVEFNDGFNSGKNAPFSFYYSREDDEWIVDAVITKEEVEALLAERTKKYFGDRDPLEGVKIITSYQPPLNQTKTEDKKDESKGKPS